MLSRSSSTNLKAVWIPSSMGMLEQRAVTSNMECIGSLGVGHPGTSDLTSDEILCFGHVSRFKIKELVTLFSKILNHKLSHAVCHRQSSIITQFLLALCLVCFTLGEAQTWVKRCVVLLSNCGIRAKGTVLSIIGLKLFVVKLGVSVTCNSYSTGARDLWQ